jgi:hypothetical protein
MAKKLLSEAQVRKFMGLANLDANLSSNFLNEMYGEPAKRDDEMMQEEEGDADTEGGDLGVTDEPMGDMDEPEMDDQDFDVQLDQQTIEKAQAGLKDLEALVSTLMAGAGEPEMDEEPPMEEPEMDMGGEEEIDAEVEVEPTEDEIVQEVARRVARRINEAARAQKKADRLLGRKK